MGAASRPTAPVSGTWFHARNLAEAAEVLSGTNKEHAQVHAHLDFLRTAVPRTVGWNFVLRWEKWGAKVLAYPLLGDVTKAVAFWDRRLSREICPP